MVAVQFFKDLTRPTVTPPPAAAGVRVRRTLYSVKFANICKYCIIYQIRGCAARPGRAPNFQLSSAVGGMSPEPWAMRLRFFQIFLE